MASYPVLVFDWDDMPNIADNVWQAQMAGWERLLTYRGPMPDAMGREIRRWTMRYEIGTDTYKIPVIRKATPKGDLFNSRDEYPFACTAEGSGRLDGRQVRVGHVPAVENSRQGGMLGAFIRHHGLQASGPNNKFIVQVIHHPRGKVLPDMPELGL